MKKSKNKQTFSSALVLALLMGMRFIMRRVRPSTVIRGRKQQTERELTKVGLTDEVLGDLPRSSFHANGKPMEAMNLVLVGAEEAVLSIFLAAGWHEADPVSPWALWKAFWAITLNLQYLTGPVTPLFVDNHIQTMAFQKPSQINKFRQRHHTRIWSTNLTDNEGQKLWIAHASFDVSIKAEGIFRFPPTHAIDADIDAERDLLVDDLVKTGAKLRGYVQMQNSFAGANAFGDEYKTDGRAAVVEIKNAT